MDERQEPQGATRVREGPRAYAFGACGFDGDPNDTKEAFKVPPFRGGMPETDPEETQSRHAFLGDLVQILLDVKKEAAARKLTLVEAVGQEEVPLIGVAVSHLSGVLDQAERLGGGVVYLLADDHLEIDDTPDFFMSLREAMPMATTPDEEESVGAMTASLDRLERLYEDLGAASYRFGYLRDGILHHVLIEDDEAAPAAAVAEMMLQDLPPEVFDEDASEFGIDPDLTRR